MSNCYVYSEAGSALRIDASITPINIWELGGSTFKTNTGYGVYLADVLGGVSLTNCWQAFSNFDASNLPLIKNATVFM